MPWAVTGADGAAVADGIRTGLVTTRATSIARDLGAEYGVVALAMPFPAMGDFMLVIVREGLAAVESLVF